MYHSRQMDTRYQKIAVYIIIIAVLIGLGFLVFRFFSGPKATNFKTVIINRDGKFTQSQISMANNEVLKIRNDDDKKHTVKKSSSDTALVEVKSRSTSRELDLPDNTRTSLYIDNNKTQLVTLVVGNAPETEANEEPAPPAVVPPTNTNNKNTNTQNTQNTSGQTAGSSTTNNLPNTGAEDLYLVPVLALGGWVLSKLSNKILD